MELINIYNNSMKIPTEWGSRQNITPENSWDLLQSIGFRKAPLRPELQPGMKRLSGILVESDGEWGRWEVNDILESDYIAQQYADYVARCVPYMALASVYRLALQRNFGPNAETNPDITKDSCTAYFAKKVANGTITPLETADSALLMALFPVLSALTPDNTTWSWPWPETP